MPKRERTAKQLANDERLRNVKKQTPQRTEETKEDLLVETVNSEPSVSDLLRMIEELKANQAPQGLQAPQVTAKGVIGIVEKYSTDPGRYPDPVERLFNEKRLEQFAFKVNYDLGWGVDNTQYETKEGLSVKEPKFTLQLNRIMMDDDGEPTNQRYVVKRLVMFEDPQTAIQMARDNGLPVDENNEISFLNEMRYLRLRDWLLEIFYPKKSDDKLKKKQEVIGNKLVEVFEVKSDEPVAIPFR